LIEHKPYDPFEKPEIDAKWQDKRYKKYRMVDANRYEARPDRIPTPEDVDDEHRFYGKIQYKRS
jgi:hypothetical protein